MHEKLIIHNIDGNEEAITYSAHLSVVPPVFGLMLSTAIVDFLASCTSLKFVSSVAYVAKHKQLLASMPTYT